MQSASKLTLDTREVADLLRPYRRVDNVTNLKWLALDYASLLLVAGTAVTFFLCRESWGLPWLANVPVTMVAVVLMGGLQHRLSGLAHEASHFCLFRNRLFNELASDLFCMFPIFASTNQYRMVHMAHHQYVNDWDRDPDLTNIGESKRMRYFPMSRNRFVYTFFVRFFYPPALLRYLWDVLYLSVFGGGKTPYRDAKAAEQRPAMLLGIRIVSLMGITYLLSLIALFVWMNARRLDVVYFVAVPVGVGLLACGVTASLPASWFFKSRMKAVYTSKTTAVLRIAYYTMVLAGFALARRLTDINFGPYFLLLWVLPLMTTFSYFMLLRDVYQHANADAGKLTNTRVFHCDPFTSWAVFVYGQGMHTPHHLLPAIPHYRLREVHELLKERCADYSESVVECEGIFVNRGGKPTVLDVMAT